MEENELTIYQAQCLEACRDENKSYLIRRLKTKTINLNFDFWVKEGQIEKTPLYIACEYKSLNTVIELLETDTINPNHGTRTFESSKDWASIISTESPLGLCFRNKFNMIALVLLTHRSTDPSLGTFEQTSKSNQETQSPLYICCTVRNILGTSHLINQKFKYRLHPTKEDKTKKSYKFFVDLNIGYRLHDVDANMETIERTPFYYCCENGLTQLVHMFPSTVSVNKGLFKEEKMSKSPIFVLLETQNPSLLIYILDRFKKTINRNIGHSKYFEKSFQYKIIETPLHYLIKRINNALDDKGNVKKENIINYDIWTKMTEELVMSQKIHTIPINVNLKDYRNKVVVDTLIKNALKKSTQKGWLRT